MDNVNNVWSLNYIICSLVNVTKHYECDYTQHSFVFLCIKNEFLLSHFKQNLLIKKCLKLTWSCQFFQIVFDQFIRTIYPFDIKYVIIIALAIKIWNQLLSVLFHCNLSWEQWSFNILKELCFKIFSNKQRTIIFIYDFLSLDFVNKN